MSSWLNPECLMQSGHRKGGLVMGKWTGDHCVRMFRPDYKGRAIEAPITVEWELK
jgi:hypothetical protein